MSASGAAPKRPEDRIRRNVDPNPKTEVTPDDEVRGFPLPEGVLPDGEPWNAVTVRWWESWRRSPQAQAMGETDWLFHLDSALMHHMMWAKGRWDFAAEVRLRVAKFGATVEDRLRLRMSIQKPEVDTVDTQTETGVTDIKSRRKRLQS